MVTTIEASIILYIIEALFFVEFIGGVVYIYAHGPRSCGGVSGLTI